MSNTFSDTISNTKSDGTLFFEWDEEKNAANKRKHGISFETAILVFTDKYRIELYDSVHSVDEERYIVIGMVEEVLFVVYTESFDAIRIISARLATKREQEVYYGR